MALEVRRQVADPKPSLAPPLFGRAGRLPRDRAGMLLRPAQMLLEHPLPILGVQVVLRKQEIAERLAEPRLELQRLAKVELRFFRLPAGEQRQSETAPGTGEARIEGDGHSIARYCLVQPQPLIEKIGQIAAPVGVTGLDPDRVTDAFGGLHEVAETPEQVAAIVESDREIWIELARALIGLHRAFEISRHLERPAEIVVR